ncbi:MAG: flagellar assembly peptidoglycan hydrolase FlgJ [Pseudomonadales bacterium]
MAIDRPVTPDTNRLYSDLNSLQPLKRQAQNNDPEALKEVARQFEQIFLQTLLKSMRDANESIASEDSVFSGGNIRFYQDMLDQQLSMEMVQGKGIGLSEVLVKQLSGQLNMAVDTADKVSGDTRVSSDALLERAYLNGANLAASAILGQQGVSETQLDSALRDSIDEFKRRRDAVYQREGADLPDTFASSKEFVEKLLPLAEQVAGELGVDPKVLLAQAALETGWGKHMVRNADGSNSYNLFNIKPGSRWQGDTASSSTLEFKDGVMQRENAHFRAYASYEDSFKDYVQFLKGSPRYSRALESAADPVQYLNLLQRAGYATDPKYADKITRIFENNIVPQAAEKPKGSG